MWEQVGFSRSRTQKYLRFSFAFFKVRLNAAKVTLAGLLLFALLIAVLDYREHKISSQVKATIVDVTLPVLNFSSEVSKAVVHDVYEFFHPDARFQAAISERDEKITALKLEIQRLQHEAGHFKQSLNFKQHPMKDKWVSTSVFLPFDVSSTYKGFVRLGEQDGVTLNCPLVSQRGLVGKVTSVSNKSAEVLLIGHPMLSVPVYVERTNHQCVVRGSSQGDLILDYAELSELQEGDRLLTSGQGEVFPRGISVGVVKKQGSGLGVEASHVLSQTHLVFVLLSEVAK